MTVPFDTFGPGQVMVTRTDVANSTPVNIGFAQELSIEFSGDVKELTGQNQFPLDVARGVSKIAGKMTAAVLSGLAWNTVFFGQTFSTGGVIWNVAEPHSVPATTPFTVTVTNSETFEAAGPGGDLGVVYATGYPLQKVASAPALGQYMVDTATGVYTFSTADEGAAVLITYRSTVTTGQTLAINNQLLGTTPIFQLDYYSIRNNKAIIVRLLQCTGSNLTIATKLEDFLMPSFDFSAFANPAQQIGSIIFPEVS